MQDSRRRIWIDAAKLKFGSFVELNAWLGDRCRALGDEVRHPEHDQFSVAEMLEHERPHLMPMPEPFDGYVENPARVTSTCLVTAARNRYSVPCELAGQTVSTRLYPGKIVVVAGDDIVTSHERLSDRGQTRYDWQHYIPLIQRKPGALRNGAPFADMPEPLQQLRRALLRDPGGDRVMAQVLAIVPTAGLDAVLVAVELALEGEGGLFVAPGISLPLPAALASRKQGEVLKLAVRPENVRLEAGQPVTAEMQLVEPLGNQHVVWMSCAGTTVSAMLPGQPKVEDGATVGFGFDAAKTMWFDAAGARIKAHSWQ